MIRLQRTLFVFFILLSIPLYPVIASTEPAKYLPEVHPIGQDHEYIRQHTAATYWRVSPFYIGQRNESSCSIASATTVVNAARNLNPILANQRLLTQESLLSLVQINEWTKGVAPDGDGLSLDQLSAYLPIALKKSGFTAFSLKTVHVDDVEKETCRRLESDLMDMEAGKSLILINFDLRFISGIEHGGHISPLGAYDAEHKKVLVMDVYRYVFEPYWAPLTTVLKSMATKDTTSMKNRGYVVVSLK